MEELSFEAKKEELAKRMSRLGKVDWSPSNKKSREFKGSERGRTKHYYINSDKGNV